jgi:pimeloyl-ACP methyl ester carboxylesterase
MPLDLSRKQFLRASGTALAVAVAGCNSPSDGQSTSATTDSPASTPENSPGGGEASDPANDADLGVFYVGPDSTDASTDSPIDGRAKVTALRPPDATEKSPVVMVPGLGLSPYIYLTTPDGRPGWATQFADAGYPVYLFDPPRNVTSGGLDTAAFGGEDPPSLSRWSLDRAWPTWGFGPEVGDPYSNVRYPTEQVDQLVASFPAYVSSGGGGGRGGDSTTGQRGDGDGQQSGGRQAGGQSSGGRFASARETAALEALLERIGSATLLVHSAGGATGFAVARSVPDRVEAIVAVEPVGAPTDPGTVAEMGGDAPFLGVYGDYVTERGQTGRKEASQTTADIASETAPKSTLLDLPAEGIAGNTHLLMQDENNDVIADRVGSWLAQ